MVSGIVVGILKEQHPDHIILSDSTRVQIPNGSILEHFPSGSRVTILYSRDGGAEMVVQSLTRSAASDLRHLPPT
jgi:hypothetical protein